MKRTTLSFDGHGINDCDEYGSRIATLTTSYKQSKFGPLFAAAPDMLEALHAILFQVIQGKVLERDACITQARAAYAKAQGVPVIDVCLAGNPAVDGVCGDDDCVCSGR